MTVATILRWLLPPGYTDPEKTRQAAMIWGLLWSLLLLSLPILLILPSSGTSFRSLAVANLFMVALLAMVKRGYIAFAGFAVPAVVHMVITYVSIRSDGIHDVATFGYFLVIAMSALVLGTRGLVFFTLLAVASYSLMALAEMNGVLINSFSEQTGTEDIVIFAVIASVFAIILRITLQTLIDHIAVAEASRRAVLERNAQLELSRGEIERLNAELERGIAERTADLQAATRDNERLFHISRGVNSAQNYVELVDAVAGHLDHPEYAVTLCVCDTFDMATARTVSVVAQRPSNSQMAIAIENDHYDASSIRQWLKIPEVLVVDDTAAPPPHMHAGMLDELQMHAAGSFMMAELIVNARVLGYITIGLPHAHVYCKHDIRVIRASAELLAPAVERMRLYSEQVDTAEHLREADDIKSKFLANMSHELRTPLNAILNFTRFVSSGMLGPINGEQQDALNKTISSGKHLLSLINDVLDVTKIESQMLTLFVEANVDLYAEIGAAAAAGEALLSEKPVTLVTDLPESLPLIVGDRRRLRQVLLNLVSNACKFTDEGTVTIKARHEGGTITIQVKDTGAGIAPEDHAVIFQPFRQARRGLITSGGTGLGLPIAQRLVEAHQGTLTLESAPGEGSTFTVTLPIASETLKAQMASSEGAS